MRIRHIMYYILYIKMHSVQLERAASTTRAAIDPAKTRLAPEVSLQVGVNGVFHLNMGREQETSRLYGS